MPQVDGAPRVNRRRRGLLAPSCVNGDRITACRWLETGVADRRRPLPERHQGSRLLVVALHLVLVAERAAAVCADVQKHT